MQPSGAQYVIRHGDQQAVAVAVGGGLRTYAAGGRDVLDGYAEDAICDGARCQTLIPWPNRVQDGTWIWEGSEQQLPLTEPEQHNAIHGLVRWLVWDLVTHTEDTVQLSCTCAPQPGYPWRLTVTNTWSRVCSISSNTARCSVESESPPIRIPSLARPAELL